jgi:hypothetical protein
MLLIHKRTNRKSLTQVCDQMYDVGFLAFLLAPRLLTCDEVDVLSDRTRVPPSVQKNPRSKGALKSLPTVH